VVPENRQTIAAGQSATATGIIPAATPNTPNSMGVGQDGESLFVSRFISIRNMANANTNNEEIAYFSKVKFSSNNPAFLIFWAVYRSYVSSNEKNKVYERQTMFGDFYSNN